MKIVCASRKFIESILFRLESFQGGSNPWISQIDERTIMGSSGQPFEDFVKATGSKDTSPIEWLEKTIIWRHMCPTAPDTLPAYPFYKKDLFIMKQCPDVYFTGNADKYETKLWKGIYYFSFLPF